MIDTSSCRRKEFYTSTQAQLLGNYVQQQGDKCRGLLWPDTLKGDLFTRPPERYIPLKVVHRRHSRFNWCKEHKNWTSHEWSRFSATSDSQRQLIWRDVGTQLHPSYDGPGVVN
ncbi:hypothetical protein TNCV_738021 [Trichonephila clavipes]|nr:hypothetical protein TNCV_738021 [Trichonephila clavipes]